MSNAEGARDERIMTPRLARWLIGGVAVLVLLLIVQRIVSGFSFGRSSTTITNTSVIEKVQSVAKLVSTESTVRDVVVFENTRFGSTKKSLVVVTGKVLVGFDLEKGTDVAVDHAERKIRITLPPASVLAVDVLEMRTYDESRGLWNPFQSSDRDRIFAEARSHILRAALQMDVKSHADRSARDFLTTMFTTDGYTAEVTTARSPALQPTVAESLGGTP